MEPGLNRSTQCVIDEAIDGLLVDPKDPQDIARAIIALLSDGNKREKMGSRACSKTVTEFTWNKLTDKVENLYLDLFTAKRTHHFSFVEGRELNR